MTIIPYQTSELEFNDRLWKELKDQQRLLDNVIYVAQQLKAKLYPAVVMNAEEKRSKRREKENTKKNEK